MIFDPVIHYPNAQNSQGWTRQNVWSRTLFGPPAWVAGAQERGASSAAFSGAGLGSEWLLGREVGVDAKRQKEVHLSGVWCRLVFRFALTISILFLLLLAASASF